MPIALLLQKPSTTLPALLAAVRALAPWLDIVRAESTVRARRRGAFLVGWFGRSIPRDGAIVRIAIANRAALDARLSQLAGPAAADSAASVVAPAASLAGMIAGSLASPVGLVASVGLLIRFGGAGVPTLLCALTLAAVAVFWIAFARTPTAIGAAAQVLPAVGAAAAVSGLVVASAEVRGLGDTAGSAARAMNSATALVSVLQGPRKSVRNPLLRRVLEFGDQLAQFGGQLLGATGVIIEYLGPRLVPTAMTLRAIRQAIATTSDALGAAHEALQVELRQMSAGDLALAPLLAKFDVVMRGVLADVGEAVGLGIDLAANTMLDSIERIFARIRRYFGEVRDFVPKVLLAHPTAHMILMLTGLAEARPKNAPKPPTRGFADILLPKVDLPDPARILKEMESALIPPLTWEAIEQQAARQQPVDVVRAARERRAEAALSGMAVRPSIFVEERTRGQARLAVSQAVFGKQAAQIDALVGALLTPAMWSEYAPQVTTAIDRVAGLVYGDVAPLGTGPARLPVLRVDEPEAITPVVRTLRLRCAGATPAELRTMRDGIVRRLDGQSYTVAPATWGH